VLTPPRPLGIPAVLALVLALAGSAVAEVVIPPSIKIEKGVAELKAPGEGQTWRRAVPGQVVDFGLVVSTDREFTGSIVYADGTTLVLKPATTLQVLSDGLRLHRGAAWIKVVKRGKGFTCVTPSAIASVRGTRFSVEVPTLTRVFARRYVQEFFSPRHLARGMRSHLLSGSIGLSMVSGLLAEAPGGRVPAAVKVYEGRVMVVYPAHTGAIKRTWMLTEGEKVDVAHADRSVKEQMVRADYDRWALPVPAALAGQAAGRRDTGISMDDLPNMGRGHADPSRPVRLLEEGSYSR
jgi:hypothetical protein